MFLESRKKIWPFVIGGSTLFLVILGFFTYRWVARTNPIDFITSKFVKQYVINHAGPEAGEAVSLLPEILGMNKPKTYLFLFENNTELRPGGGFIGVYALVTVDKGNVRVVRVEGTDEFDARTPAAWKPVPPKPLSEHLGVDRWYFRDSNWSPDFAESAKKALELYRGQGGELANDIDAVVAITPTVLEELLKLTGSVQVQGITFDASNVVRDLEYEVEYGYAKRGVSYEQRKQIIEPLVETILARLKNNIITQYKRYIVVGQRLAQEKQIMVYALDPKLETLATRFESTGRMHQGVGDYLMWVDANLGALKTDYAIQRTLDYTIKPDANGYMATAAMTYKHAGKFDWRTTRYRTYARIFVPAGATLIGVEGSMKTDRSKLPGMTDQGNEDERHWFGTFISIEPGETKTLIFTYHLPFEIVQNNIYNLLVQKQLGASTNKLTLTLPFGTTSTTQTTDLRVDREFTISY